MTNEALTAITLGSGFLFLLLTFALVGSELTIKGSTRNQLGSITGWVAMASCWGFLLGLAKLANLI